MSKTKSRKSTLFSRLLVTSLICGTALGFSGRASAYAEPTALYDNNGAGMNVFAAGEYACGAYAHDAYTVNFAGKAISLTASEVAVYAHDTGTGAETGTTITLGVAGTTDFIALSSIGGIVAEGEDSTHVATVTTAGKYLGIYTNAASDTGGVVVGHGTISLNSESIVINAAGDKTIGVGADREGNITINGSLYVNATTAVETENGGHIEINWDKDGAEPNTNTTVLNGNIKSADAPHTIQAKLYGKDSSWTGNVTKDTDSNIEIKLVDGATWNATTVTDTKAVTILTADGGFIEMRNNQIGVTGEDAQTAKVTTLAGTKGAVHMDSDDILQATTISNSDLTVYGGKLEMATSWNTIAAEAKVTLDGTTVQKGATDSTLEVKGELNGTSITVDNAKIQAGDGGKVVLAGNTTATKSGEVFYAVSGGEITVSGDTTIVNGSVNASGGKITLNAGTTTVNGGKLIATGGTLNVASELSATSTGEVIESQANNAVININTDGKHSTVLNGTIRVGESSDIVTIDMTKEGSYWTGNVVQNKGELNIDLGGHTWNVTKVSQAADYAVTKLTMSGGVIDMTNATNAVKAVAKVVTLDGTKGIVDMNGVYDADPAVNTADTLEVTIFDNDDLTINGGVLKVVKDSDDTTTDSTILAGDKLTLDKTTVTGDPLTVKGELKGTDVTVDAALKVWQTDGKAAGKATLSGDTATMKGVSVMGLSDEKKSSVLFDATTINTEGLEAYSYSTIDMKGNTATVTGVVKADTSGVINLDSATSTTVNGSLEQSTGGYINVNTNLTLTAGDDETAVKLSGGKTMINTDGKHTTVITGNIDRAAEGSLTANLVGSGSSWTGNQTTSDGGTHITLADGAKWDATTVTDAKAVKSLTVNGGTIDMTDATKAVSAVAKVTTLSGSAATVKMDVATLSGSDWTGDTFAIGTNKNENLTIEGGILGEAVTAAGITNTGVINLKNVVVNAEVKNQGTDEVVGTVNIVGGTSGAENANTVTANKKIANKINVATQYDTLSIDADYVGNEIINKGTVALTADGADSDTLTKKIIGGNVNVDGDVVHSDASNFVNNTITVSGGTAGKNLQLTGKITNTDKTGLFDSNVKGDGTITVEGGADADHGNTIAMRTSQLGMSTAGTDDDFTGGISVLQNSTLTLSGDVKGLTTLVNSENGTLFIHGDVGAFTTGGTFSNLGSMTVVGDVGASLSNDGTAVIAGDVLSGGTITNNAEKTVILYGDVKGKFENNSDVTTNHIYGNVLSGGTLTNTKTLTIDGNIEAGSTVTNTSGGTLSINGDVNSAISNESDIKLKGGLNANITGGQITLTGEVDVTQNVTISGKLNGENKTFNMADGDKTGDTNKRLDTLTIGQLFGTVNVKIDMAKSGTSTTYNEADYVAASDTGGTINLVSVNVTETLNQTAPGASTVIANDCISSLTVLGTNGGTTTTYASDGDKYSFTNSGKAIATTKDSGGNTIATGLTAAANGFSLVDDASIEASNPTVTVDVNATTKEKDIYLNNHTLSSSNSGGTTLVIDMGKTVNIQNGTLADTVNLSVSGGTTAKLNMDKVILKGDLTNGGGTVVIEKGKIDAGSEVYNNSGTMDFKGDTVVMAGANVTNNGGTMSFEYNNDVGGTITNNGGTIAFLGDSDVSGAVVNKATMTFWGDNDVTKDISNSGSMTFGGDNYVGDKTSHINIENSGSMTFSDSTVVDAYINNTTSGVITFTGTTVVNKDITNAKTMTFNGITDINAAIKNSKDMTFNGSAKLYGDVENNYDIKVNGNMTTGADAKIHGIGTLTIDGRLDAGAAIDQGQTKGWGVELLDDDTVLIIGATNLQSKVKNTAGSTVVLKTGELDAVSVITNGNIVLTGDVTANADSLASKTLDLGTNTLTLNGGELDGYQDDNSIAIKGNEGAKIVVAGAVTAVADVLTVDTKVNSGKALTLNGGTLADGVEISGEGKVVVSEELEARIQDLQVKGGIDNGSELTLTGEGKLLSNISNDEGDLIITGKVDAGKKKIKQDSITVKGGELTIDVGNWTVDNQATINVYDYNDNKGNLYLTGDDNWDLMKNIKGTGTTHIGDGTNTASMQLHKGYEINTALVVEKNATFNLNAEYENETAIVNAGKLYVDLANLNANVTNSKVYAVEHALDKKVDGTVYLTADKGQEELNVSITGGTLYIEDSINADTDGSNNNLVAADKTYIKSNETLTLNGGTLKGDLLKITDYEGKVVIAKDDDGEHKIGGKDVNGVVVAAGKIQNDVTVEQNAVLAIAADNLKGTVTLYEAAPVEEGQAENVNGKIELGAGALADGNTITGGDIQLTGDVTTDASNLVDNELVNIGKTGDKANVLTISGGDLTVDIGSETANDGTLKFTGNTASTKVIYTNIEVAKNGTLTADVNNIWQVTAEGAEAKTIVNDGTLTLSGGTAYKPAVVDPETQEIITPEVPETADEISRAITGTGTLNIGVNDILSSANGIEQGIVNNAGKLTMTSDLIAYKYVHNKANALLTIDANNLKGAVGNLGTVNLGAGTLENGIIGVDPSVTSGSVITAAGVTNIKGDVISKADIAQATVNIEAGKSLTMASEANLYAEDKINVAENAVLSVAAADLRGNVMLAKATPVEEPEEGEEPAPKNANGKLVLGTGVLNNTITGGDVELSGNVKTVGTNFVNGTDNNNLTVDLAGQNLYISGGALDVEVNNKSTEAGALVILGETTANKGISTAVGITTTGALTIDADKLYVKEDITADDPANTVINYGTLNLTGGTIKKDAEGEVEEIEALYLTKNVEGTGTTVIDGIIITKKAIQQNNVVINAGKRLDTYAQLLANVYIAAAEDGKDAAVLGIGASNLQGAVANEGILTLEDGTYQGVDEYYKDFVASINGTGTTNINATEAVNSDLAIKQGVINVNSGTFNMNNVLIATDKTNVKNGATMNIGASNIKGNVVNDGTINFSGGTLNVSLGDASHRYVTNKDNGVINVPNGTTIDSEIVNANIVNTYGNVTMNSEFKPLVEQEGEVEVKTFGTVNVQSGTLTFMSNVAGSFDNNAVIAAGATLDPLARVFSADSEVVNYGTLVIQEPTPEVGSDYLKAAIIADGKYGEGIVELHAGTIALEGGSITQKNNAVLEAVGNDGSEPVITNVTSADQLNVGDGVLKLTGTVGGTIVKNQPFTLITGDAVKEVVAQDLLTNKKLWKSVEMTDETGTKVSNTDPNAKFVTDYVLSNDGKSIVAEVRTIKSIDEINTNGLAGVQQGALTMMNQMNDKVADNMSLVARPAAAKGKKYDKQIWASYINTKEDLDERELWNLKADNTAKYKGAIVGVDFYSSKKAIAGVALSYATGDITANTANRTHVKNDAKYYGVTLYDRVTNGDVAWTYDLGYQNGKNEISMNARENITADVKTNAYTAGIRVERAYKSGKNSTVAPFASVRYTRLNTGDYTNSNKSKFDSSSQNLFIPKVGVAWKGNYGDSVKGWAFNPVVEVGYMFNAGSRNAETKYLSSTNNMFNAEYDIVDSGTYYGRVGMNFVNKRFSFGVDYRYLKGSTTKNSKWNVNLGYSF